MGQLLQAGAGVVEHRLLPRTRRALIGGGSVELTIRVDDVSSLTDDDRAFLLDIYAWVNGGVAPRRKKRTVGLQSVRGERRLPFSPLDVGLDVSAIALRLGVDRRQVYRWRESGVTVTQADELAVRLGCHPTELWADFYEETA